MRPSLRARLLIFLLPPLVIIMIASVLAQYYLSVRPAGRAFDQALSDAAVALSQAIDTEGGRVKFALSEETARLLRSDSTDEIYFAVRGPAGEFIAGDLGLMPFINTPSSPQPWVYDGTFNQQKVRVAAVSTDCGRSRCQIEVAETLNKRGALINGILLGTIVPQLILGGLATLWIWLGIGQALQPLARLSRAIESRSSRDLTAIDAETAPAEAKSLVRALNDLLEKLRESSLAQQRFIATAAHELRTPLTGLKAETELALLDSPPPEVREKLERINRSVVRASRLATQLLALARSEPDAHGVDAITAVDLESLVKEHIDEWVRMAAIKNIDLGFDLQPAVTTGRAELLRELMRNLVHNALEYSPPNAKVTVHCGTTRDSCYFEVEDNGPGIPAEYREKIFERFYRCPGTSGTGSGLGLAIVKEAALAHGANIKISDAPDGQGTRVRVNFPRKVETMR